LPATLIVPERALRLVFEPAVIDIVAEPLPEAAEEASHPAPVSTDQAHPDAVVIVTFRLPPPVEYDSDVGETEKLHVCAAGWRKLAAVAAVLFSARALSCALATPVGRPEYVTDGFEKYMTRVALPYDITVRNRPPGSW
jgi:hypothetical protein